MGEIFRLAGGLSLISSQLTKCTYSCSTFSRVSACSCVQGSGCRVEGCAPLARVALISSMFHLSSMMASQPLVANLSSMGAVGCSRAGLLGATSPMNAYGYLLWSDDSSRGGGSGVGAIVACWVCGVLSVVLVYQRMVIGYGAWDAA